MILQNISRKKSDFFYSQNHDFGAAKSRTTAVDFLQNHQNHDFVQNHVRVTGPLKKILGHAKMSYKVTKKI